MKILMVNKFFYIKGGSETYYFSLKKLLEQNGHTLIDFSMKNEKNFYSPYSDYFINEIDYNTSHTIKEKIRLGIKVIYSNEARKELERLVIAEKPDLIHLHIFQHQLSPSILDVAKKYNIPTVYTAHDLKMLCLNYKMMNHGKICESCKGGHYYHCLLNKCVKDSFMMSCINVVEGYFHKWRKSYDTIDIIITPSLFYKKKFEEFGIRSEKIVHIPNFVPEAIPKINIRNDSLKYYLYFGRLSEEKGVMTLIKAFEGLDAILYIAGIGPLERKINDYIVSKKLHNIKMLGFLRGQDLSNIIGNAKAIIIPSEWYENGPYSAIETLQLGRPIIGAKIGGIPELINENGYTFISGDAMSLRDKIIDLEQSSREEYTNMENQSVHLFEQYHKGQYHYNKIIQAYGLAMKNKTPNYN